MRLLDRYLLRELAAPLLYCLAGFLVFWISFDVLAELENFRERQLGLREVLLYYTFRLPELLNVVLPITLLLALLYALGQHNRHNEIVAMRAAGRSLGRLILPYLGVGTVCSLLLLATNEWWLPNHSA